MPNTPYRNWEYPLKGLKPYYIEIVSFYEAVDLDVNTLFNRLDNLSVADLVANVTKGNLLVGDGSNYTPLSPGSDGYVLSSDSTQPNGLRWIENSGGGGGGHRLRAVIDYVDNTAAPPTENSGDRYILDFTGASHPDWDGASAGEVVEYSGTTWEATPPVEGYITYVDDEDQDRRYIDDGVPTWEPAASGGGVFVEGTGTGSALRDSAGNTAAGEYSFVAGQNNAASSSHTLVAGYQNSINDALYSTLLGWSNTFTGTSSQAYATLVSGYLNTVDGPDFSAIIGTNNSVTGANYTLVAGEQLDVTGGVGNTFLGFQNTVAGGEASLVGGRDIDLHASGTDTAYSSIVWGASHEVAELDGCVVGGYSHELYSADKTTLLGENIHAYDTGVLQNSIAVGYGHKLFRGSSFQYGSVFGRLNNVNGGDVNFVAGELNSVYPTNIGTSISLSAPVANVVTVTDTEQRFHSLMDGATIIFSGANNAGNNGSFGITYVGAGEITINNPSGVVESGNSDLRWTIGGGACMNVTMFGSQNSAWNGSFQHGMITGNQNSATNGSGHRSVVTGQLHSFTSGGGNNSLVGGQSNYLTSGGGTSSIVGGNENYIHTANYMLTVGRYNRPENNCTSFILGGEYNRITNSGANNGHSSIVNGVAAKAYFPYAVFTGGDNPATPASDYTDAGEAQVVSNIPHNCQTTNATPTTMYLGASSDIVTPNDHAFVVKTYVIAKCGAGDSSDGIRSWELITTLNNVGGTLSIVGSVVNDLSSTSVSHEADWDVEAIVYDTNKFGFQATGHANDTDIRWQCTSNAAEVGIG